MSREVREEEGTLWTCIQAYAGLGNDPDKVAAARPAGNGDKLHVVCTPRGGARSVRLDLQQGWEAEMSDKELLAAIKASEAG